MSIGELVRIKFTLVKAQLGTVFSEYPKNWRFALADSLLGLASLFFNPYRACRKRGFVYGETPISSLRRIASFCQLKPEDVWLELGSGRGKGAFWISQTIGCETAGVEAVPLFVNVARAIVRILRLPKISFTCGKMADADFSKATCVYLYSTCMEEEELASLSEKMKALPPGARVLTVSAPLPETAHLPCAGSFPLSFPWGETEGFLHVYRK